MRNIKKLVAALRAVAVVLLLAAVVVTIYNLATTGTAWKELKTKLEAVGAETGLVERGRFDADYSAALSAAAASKEESIGARSQKVAGKLAHFAEAGTLAEAKLQESELQAQYDYYNAEFDAAGYVESLTTRANPEEIKKTAEIYEYLDGLAAPAKGKKIAKLKLADNRPAFEELHAAWTAEHGEEVGSFFDFSQTVELMVREAIDGGTAITNAAEYFTQNVLYEDYLLKLAEVSAAEAGEAGASLLDAFAAVAAQKAAGESADFKAFFEEQYVTVSGLYPDQALPSEALFVSTVRGLIESGAAFDGTYGSVYAALQSAQEAANSNSFSRFMSNFCRSVVNTADESGIGFFRWLWAAAGLYWLMYILAAALAILAAVLDRVLSYALVARQERKQIQDDPDVLLRVNHLKQYFRSGDFVNKAVDDVSFYVKKGEVFGLVGESGCGKTTTGRTIINLYDPTEGDVYFQGLRISSNQNGLPVLLRQLKNEHEQAVAKLRKELEAKVKERPEMKGELTRECNAKIKEMEKALADRIESAQMSALESSVEKDRCVKAYREKRQAELTAEYEADMKSLSGKEAQERKERYELEMKVAAKDNIMTKMQMIFQDPIASINPRMTVREIIAEGLIIRGIKDKAYIDEKVYEMLELVGLVREHADRYPHEFSGGQRQRIGIARAIVMEPDLIIADEPISALDVSIQAQVINLLNDLRNKMGLTIMFIAHNLSVVKYFSDRIAVMYFGKIVEMTTSDELFEHPLHPYTKSLLSAIPYPDPHYEKQRKRIEYKPELVHDYSVGKPVMREITPGHFIYCNNAEFEAYKKELGI